MAVPQHDNHLDHLLSGAYIELDDLIGARFAAKDLKLQQRRNTLSLLAGPNKTNFRGRGIDFEEVRAYQAGDDIRSIDWRVTARSGKPYTKLFREERERPMLVVCDQRQGMYFGSQCCFKSVLASYLSTLIAWSGLQQSDRVGGLVFGNSEQMEIRPRRNQKSVLAFINQLIAFNHRLDIHSGMDIDHGARMVDILTDLRRIAKPGSAIYLISDFAGCEQELVQKHLYQLSRHCEISAINILDPLEHQLPPAGQYTVSDGQHRSNIFTGNRQLRQQFSRHFEQQQQLLQSTLNKLGIPVLDFYTNQAPLRRLLNFYGTGA